MAAIKFVLLFAALSVASVSADTNLQQQWDSMVNNIQNVTQKLATNFGPNNEQLNSIKTDITHTLDAAREKVETLVGEAKVIGMDVLEKMNNTFVEKTGINTQLSAEGIQQVFQTIGSQFGNLTSNAAGYINEVKQALLPSFQEMTSAVTNVTQKIVSDVTST